MEAKTVKGVQRRHTHEPFSVEQARPSILAPTHHVLDEGEVVQLEKGLRKSCVFSGGEDEEQAA